ncbi:MAG: malate dehydrogenase [Chloroflexi bacterium]|nr:malate dehydrogenase [Chloroflexota bacterium]
MSRRKITVVGAGNVGATLAQRLAERGYADIVLVDIVEGLPQGKALDMLESMPVLGVDVNITGTNGYEETAGSDVVVITSGIARRPGMSRDDLIATNQGIVKGVVEQIAPRSPNSVIIIVTNPLDAMCHVALEASGFPKERVIGQSGVLDTARFRTFLAQELGASVQDVQAYVLGGHGDTMVPLSDTTNVAGVPIRKLIPADRLAQIEQRTRDGGGEIVALLKTGSAYYAPSAATAQMVDAIMRDTHQILPTCVLLEGQYGVDGLYVGVPAKLGAGGVERIIELELSELEQGQLQNSVNAVRELVEVLHRPKA